MLRQCAGESDAGDCPRGKPDSLVHSPAQTWKSPARFALLAITAGSDEHMSNKKGGPPESDPPIRIQRRKPRDYFGRLMTTGRFGVTPPFPTPSTKKR